MEGGKMHWDDEVDVLQAQCLAHCCTNVVCCTDKHVFKGITQPHSELKHRDAEPTCQCAHEVKHDWCGRAQSTLGGGVCRSHMKEGWGRWVRKGGGTVRHASVRVLYWDWMDVGTGWWSGLKNLCNIGSDDAVGVHAYETRKMLW
ncbi:hypothetical protein ID866_13281 [Astraeus odoratus]|nr:hypothetical protein ID866_13281 [Astraeus odoratus]